MSTAERELQISRKNWLRPTGGSRAGGACSRHAPTSWGSRTVAPSRPIPDPMPLILARKHPQDGFGICRAGYRTCSVGPNKTTASWTACSGSVAPGPRNCASPADNDCDGKADNAVDHGAMIFDYTGQEATFQVPPCITRIEVDASGGQGGISRLMILLSLFSRVGLEEESKPHWSSRPVKSSEFLSEAQERIAGLSGTLKRLRYSRVASMEEGCRLRTWRRSGWRG
jgi:hypothetical protein